MTDLDEAVNVQGSRLLAALPPVVRPVRWDESVAYFADRPGKTDAVAAACEMVAEGHVSQRGRPRFCLCLTGDYGTGKTFLGTATYKQLVRRHLVERLAPAFDAPTSDAERRRATERAPHVPRPEWVKFYDFVRSVQAAYHRTSEVSVADVLRRYQTAPVLMLDDVGDLDVEVESEDRRRLLYEVLDHRNDHRRPTVLTTNLSLGEFAAQFGGRTVQRVVEMAALVEMRGANLRGEG